MEHNQYTLEQAKELLQIKEVVDVKQTCLAFLPGVPFFVLLFAWVIYSVNLINSFSSPELRLLSLIVIVFAFVRMAGWVGNGWKIITKYETK